MHLGSYYLRHSRLLQDPRSQSVALVNTRFASDAELISKLEMSVEPYRAEGSKQNEGWVITQGES